MQFILSKEEFDELVGREEKIRQQYNEHLMAAGDLVLEVGKYKCWRVERSRGYCDNCPLAEKRLLCTRPRDWSK